MDFREHGYHVIRELGRNREGGRITWLATDINTGQPEVIKQFGFARIGSHDVAGSSVFKGTPDFIPPEQMFKPTNATDLYALGATLICLLTGIKSTKIDQLQIENPIPDTLLEGRWEVAPLCCFIHP